MIFDYLERSEKSDLYFFWDVVTIKAGVEEFFTTVSNLWEQVIYYAKPTWLLPITLIVLIFGALGYYFYAIAPRQGTLEWIHVASRPPIRFAGRRHKCDKKDAIAAAIITVIYAITALFQLGSLSAPQTFYQFQAGEQLVINLEEPVELTEIFFYTGLYTGEYSIELTTVHGSEVVEEKLAQPHGKLFRWLTTTLETPVSGVTAITLTASRKMELGELELRTSQGVVSVDMISTEATELFDETEVIPAASHWYNSSYFDEIYHGRTAYEHLTGVYPYETTHPPLGKLLISIGISLFGMTPFGWRIVGTLFGIGMVPILYAFLKNVFGKRVIAICGAVLLATDFMHLTQTRIATIDTYAVFFIILMYYFMYRYLTLPEDAKFSTQMRELGLCGLFWGIGAACKWTVIYGGIGLAVIYFIAMAFRFRDWKQEKSGKFTPWCVKTLGMSVLFFILIPAAIYVASYLPYLTSKASLDLAVMTLGEKASALWEIVWKNQEHMLSYHAAVTESHPYQSEWWKWIFDIRPILYYLDNTQVATTGLKTAFGAFTNPLTTWAGLLAVFVCAGCAVKAKSGVALFIVIGYLAQVLPWLPITRPTFAYHYFPAVPFLIFAICYLLNELITLRGERMNRLAYGFAGVSTGLYAAFYPVLIGLPVPVWYTSNLLQWFPSWPF